MSKTTLVDSTIYNTFSGSNKTAANGGNPFLSSQKQIKMQNSRSGAGIGAEVGRVERRNNPIKFTESGGFRR